MTWSSAALRRAPRSPAIQVAVPDRVSTAPAAAEGEAEAQEAAAREGAAVSPPAEVEERPEVTSCPMVQGSMPQKVLHLPVPVPPTPG